jgi:calcineurin-like phosphoesterase family protein
MLCGHVHEAWKRHVRVINVGVDVWDFYPVSVDQLLEVMKEG